MSHDYEHQRAIHALTPDTSAEDFAGNVRRSVRGLDAGESYDDPDSEHHVSRHRVGIGRKAVLLAYDEVARGIDNADEFIDNRESLKQVDEVTLYLAGLKGRERFATNMFIGSHVSNEWLFTRLGIPKDEQGSVVTDYLEYLTATNPETNEFVIDQHTRLNFLEWYNAQLAQLTREVEANKPAIIQQFTQRFEGLVNRGIVPASALENLSRLDNLELVVDDGPLTAWRGTTGTYLSNKDAEVIHLSPVAIDYFHDPDSKTITHELWHAMSGERDIPVDDAESLAWHDRDKMYGFEKRYGWQQGSTGQILNEAMTEYLTLAAIDEDESHDTLTIDDGEYRGGRQLLAVLSSFGLEKIPITYFTDVHFAKHDSIDAAVDRLNERLIAAFPGVANKHGETIVTLLEELSSHALHQTYHNQKDDYTFGALGAFCDELLAANYAYVNSRDAQVTEVQWLAAISNYYKHSELLKPGSHDSSHDQMVA